MTKKLLTQRIKSLRENKGWTQSDLERESGVAQAHISRLETGKSPSVSAAILGQLADVLGTNVDYLMGRTDNPAPVPMPNHPVLKDPAFQELMAAWLYLSDIGAKEQLGFIRDLAVQLQRVEAALIREAEED